MRGLIYSLFAAICLGFSDQALGQVLSYDTTISVDKRGRKTTLIVVRKQINTKESNWLSHVEIRHNPMQRFTLNAANIIDTRGNITRTVKKKDVITKNDISHDAFFQHDLVTEFDLTWDQYPYQIEYSYTIIEEEFVSVTWWTPLFHTSVPTVKSSLQIDIPIHYEVHIDGSGELILNETILGERRILSWQSALVRCPEFEILAPPVTELISYVSVVPKHFTYGIHGSSDSWSALGCWIDNLNGNTGELPESEKAIIEKLVEGLGSKTEIIKTLYHYLQDQTQYVNVAIDVGGLKSYPASYVCRNKYGDCKALTSFMKALLKHFGIESLYTLVNAGENSSRIRPHHPGQQFNHVILVIPGEGDTIWLENTAKHIPYNYLGTFTQNRIALAVNGGESQLVLTPKLDSADVLLQRTYQFTHTGNNIWDCDIELSLRGQAFEAFRYHLLARSELDKKNEILTHIPFGGFELANWTLNNFHRDSAYISLTAAGTCSGRIREVARLKVINPLHIVIPDFEDPESRRLEVRINYPVYISDKSVYNFKDPSTTEIILPEEFGITSPYGRYKTQYAFENDQILVQEEFLLFARDIPLEEYASFYAFLQSIMTHKKKSAVLLK